MAEITEMSSPKVVIGDEEREKAHELLLEAFPDPIQIRDDFLLGSTFGAQEPEPPSLLETFTFGLTGGRLGSAPESLGGAIASLTGEASLIGLLSFASGGLLGAAGLSAEGLSLAGRVGFGALREALTGSLFSAITEKEDFPEVVTLFSAFGAGAPLVGRALEIIKPPKTLPEFKDTGVITEPKDISAITLQDLVGKGQSVFRKLDSAVQKLLEQKRISPFDLVPARTAMERDILELNKLNQAVTDRKIAIIKDLEKEERASLYGEDGQRFFLTKGRQAVRERFKLLLQKDLKGKLSQDELDVLFERIPETNIIPRTMLKRVHRDLARFNIVKTEGQGIRDDFIQKVDNFINRKSAIESRIVMGLLPNASSADLKRRILSFQQMNERALRRLSRDTELKGLFSEVNNVLQSIEENKITGLTPEFQETKEFLSTFRTLAELASESNLLAKSLRAQDLLKEYQKLGQGVIEKSQKYLISAFKNTSKPLTQAFKKVQAKIEFGQPLSESDFKGVRESVSRYLIDQLQKADPAIINPSLSRQLNELTTKLAFSRTSAERKVLEDQILSLRKDMALKAFSDLKSVERIAMAVSDRQLYRYFLLHRASLGDIASKDILKHELNPISAVNNMALDHAVARAIVHNRSTSKTLTDSKIDIGNPPPSGITESEPLKTVEQIISDMENVKDLTFGEKNFGTFVKSMDRRAFSATNPVEKKLFQDAADWARAMRLALRNFTRQIETVLRPLFTTLSQKIESLPKPVQETALAFIDDIQKFATEQRLAKVPDTLIERMIADKVAGQTPAVREVYNIYRQIGDEYITLANSAIDNFNAQVITELGGKPIARIKRRPGWTPFIYNGDFVVRIIDSEGNIRFTDIVRSREDAIATLKEEVAKSAHYGGMTGRVVIQPRFTGLSDEVPIFGRLLDDIDKLYGIDAHQVEKMIADKTLRPDTVDDIFFGHALPRRLNLETRKLDTIQATALAGHATLRFVNLLIPVRQGQILFKMFKDLNAPEIADAIKLIVEDSLGRTRTSERYIDNAIKQFVNTIISAPIVKEIAGYLGIEKAQGRIVRNVSSALTYMGRFAALGFSVGTYLINTFIFLTNVVPVIGFKNALYALRNISKALSKNPDPELAELFNLHGIKLYTMGLGTRDSILTPDLIAGRGKRLFKKIEDIALWGFNKSEEVTRALTLIGARRNGQQIAKDLLSGKTPSSFKEKLLNDIAVRRNLPVNSNRVLNEFADRITEMTNFSFDLPDMIPLARNPLARPFLQFKSFFLKEMGFVFGDLRRMGNKEFLTSLGMLTALGGYMALPGTRELDALGRIFFGFSVDNWIEQHFGELFGAGLPTIVGLDLSPRVNFGDLAYTTNTTNIAGIVPGKIFTALKSVIQGRPVLATRQILPSFARGVIETLELLRTGKVTDPFRAGHTVVNLDDLNAIQIIGRAIGFPTAEEQQIRRRMKAGRALIERENRLRRDAMRRIISARESNDFKTANEIKAEYGFDEQTIQRAIKAKKRTLGETLRDMAEESTEEKVIKAIPDLDEFD